MKENKPSLFTLLLFMLFFFVIGEINIWSLFLPVLVLYLACSVVVINASSYAMEHAQDKSNGSAVMNFVNMGCAAISVFIAQAIKFPSSILLPLFFLGIVIILFLLQWRLKSFLNRFT
jgi:hypothetical protein